MRRFAEHLQLQDFRLRTMQGYYRHMGLISRHFKCDPSDVSEEQLREYYVHKRTKGGWAPKSCRQSLAAVKHFYRGMLGLEYGSLDAIKARDRETLPTVLTVDELRRLFAHVRFNRYRIPLLLIYACGLRVNECMHLTVDDIDGSGNRLFIRDGKGGKDRYTILSSVVYALLQCYWKHHKNPKWLFPAVGRGSSANAPARMGAATEPMDSHGLGLRLLEAARAAGITKRVTCHILRHSFATHLASAGVPLHQLQSYLGHAHIETTTVYTHLMPINHIEAIGHIEGLIAPILRR
jgi:site-specific recombinase XerD